MAADRAITGLAVRETRRGAVITAVASAGMLAAIISSYDSVNLGSLQGMNALVDNPAVRAIYGPAYDISTAAGFTVWRAGTFVLVIGGLWVVLASTRVLRGEEEAGRWDLLLAQPVEAGRAVIIHVAVLAGACVLSGLAVTLTFILSGAAAGGAVLFGVAVLLFMALFAAIGALTSQLFGQRSRAAGVAGAALAVSFVVRMLADASSGLQWLRWATPIGWVESLQAFAGNHLGPLVPLLLAPALIGTAAVVLAGPRDLGNGVLRASDRSEPHTRLLGNPTAFSWRQGLGGLVGWSIGVAFYGLVIGAIANAFADFIAGSPEMQEFVARFGMTDLTSPAGLLANMDGMVAVALSLYAVTWVRRMLDDETSDRLEGVLAQPVSKPQWLGGLVTATAGAVIVVSGASVVATWAGAAVGNADLTLSDVFVGLLNYLSLVAVFFGIAVLLYGTRPHLAVPLAGGAVVGAFLLSLFGPLLNWPDWLVGLSPFDHVAMAPIHPIEWGTWSVMLAVGVVAAAIGFVGYQRRDLA
jgi:ABC-2 type transport system permease protein